jgi:phosphoribosylamine-glycine ligase
MKVLEWAEAAVSMPSAGNETSPRVTELYCSPGNGGIAEIATLVPIKATANDEPSEYAVKEKFVSY